jgi:hypothetical protein
MHVYDIAGGAVRSWPSVPIGVVRLWDANTTWRDLNPAPGVWNWAPLDNAVEAARVRGAIPLLPLGQTPQWASSRPTETNGPGLGPGAQAMPTNIADWRNYVAAVATRYKGRIRHYEIWNEPNIANFFSGTPEDLKLLSQVAYQTIKKIDPRATVLSPGFATRRPAQRSWIVKYLRTQPQAYFDAVSLHLYPFGNQTPEDVVPLLNEVRRSLTAFKVTKPIWNNEINYGLTTGGTGVAATPLDDATSAAYVTRTYVLAANNGLTSVAWYGWSPVTVVGVGMLNADGSLSAGGRAYATTFRWIVGARPMGCVVTAKGVTAGTYTCTFKYGRGYGKIVWHPKKSYATRTPSYTTGIGSANGAWSAKGAGARYVVGPSPVLIRTYR